MAALVVYGSNVADSTLTNACDMASASGGAETSTTTTVTGLNVVAEVLSQGGTTASIALIPATPTGKGWVYQPGAGTFAQGNWSASCTLALAVFDTGSVWKIRFFRYSSGVYTSIGTIIVNASGTAKTTYAFLASSMNAITFGSSDLLYVDLWLNDPTTAGTTNPTVYVSTSSSAGVASDMQVTTSSFTATGGNAFSRILVGSSFSPSSPGGI